MDEVDLSAVWKTFWNAVTEEAGANFSVVLSVVGLIIVIFTLLGYVWKRWRNQGAQMGQMWLAILLGGLFAAPAILIPLLLFLVDLIANVAINLWNTGWGN